MLWTLTHGHMEGLAFLTSISCFSLCLHRWSSAACLAAAAAACTKQRLLWPSALCARGLDTLRRLWLGADAAAFRNFSPVILDTGFVATRRP